MTNMELMLATIGGKKNIVAETSLLTIWSSITVNQAWANNNNSGGDSNGTTNNNDKTGGENNNGNTETGENLGSSGGGGGCNSGILSLALVLFAFGFFKKK